MHHAPISPAILYWGTPVVLITTTNPDNSTTNIAPISSAFWLGDRCMLGLARNSQTTANLLRTRQCVLNLPSSDMTTVVNKLARTTGTNPVPANKQSKGYHYVGDKFSLAGLTPSSSELISPPRITECPVHMETELVGQYTVADDDISTAKGFALALEVRVLRTYVDDRIRMHGKPNRVDPDKWRPMIMSFQGLYGLAETNKLQDSTLAGIDEELYRLPPPPSSSISSMTCTENN